MTSTHLTRRLCMAVLLASVAFVAHGQKLAPSSAPAKSQARSQLEALLAAPQDEKAFRAFLASLPKVTLPGGLKRYVVEGDLLLTEDQVRSLIARNIARTRLLKSDERPELIVNEVGGKPDFWVTSEQRKLTYAIDRASFSANEYEQIRKQMMAASGDWVKACTECGISFTHQSEFDDQPNLDKVTFIVRQLHQDGAYIAAAFFPSDPKSSRFLNIERSYFNTTFDQVGVLRHELGHVLGYRHEHTRGVAGCFFEDEKWLPLTVYDPKSVMHYLCGDGGSRKLELTALDVAGHGQQYRPKSKIALAAEEPQVALLMRFEGGDVAQNMFEALSSLAVQGHLVTTTRTVQEADNPCSLIHTSLSLPSKIRCVEKPLTTLWRALNPDIGTGPLQIGQQVIVPTGIRLSTYEFAKTFDKTSASDQKRERELSVHWSVWLKNTTSQATLNKSIVEGYAMQVPIKVARRAPLAMAGLEALRSENFYVDATDWAKPGSASQHSGSNGYNIQCKSSQGPPQANYAELIYGQKPPSCAIAKCQGNCPDVQVMMIDTPVAAHPRLARALGMQDSGSEPRSCNTVDWQSSYHGTHMAGIVAASTGGKTGMVGLSPLSRLRPFNRAEANVDDQIATHVSNWTTSGADYSGFKIFLFASDYVTEGAIRGSQYSVDTQRFVRSRASKLIRDASDLLLVTAAGQGDQSLSDDDASQHIYPTSKTYLMNLGDLANVLVVTACTGCSGKEPRLMRRANVGVSVEGRSPLVHLAAPGGEPIPGLANQNAADITYASGTSQAAAFVAGTAAAVAKCYPNRFATPAQVKRRLLVTSRPVLAAEDQRKVATGIVDYDLALRDPGADWLMGMNPTERQNVKAAGWCAKEVEMKMLDTDEVVRIPTARIRRLFKTEVNGQGAWYVYANGISQPTEVVKIGPGKLTAAPRLLKLSGAPEIVIGTTTISDLLLGDREVGFASCGPTAS